jgi:DNA-binding NarL/FixJ family response regulator
MGKRSTVALAVASFATPAEAKLAPPGAVGASPIRPGAFQRENGCGPAGSSVTTGVPMREHERLRGERDVMRVVVVMTAGLARLGIEELLRAGGLVVLGTADDARSARNLVDGTNPDVVLIDATPSAATRHGMRALVLKACRRAVVLVEASDERAAIDALGAGAWACVTADASADEIIAGTQAAAHGELFVSTRLARRLVKRLSPLAGASQSAPELTVRERQVLDLVAQGWDNMQIGAALYLSQGTVKRQLASIFRKLEVDNRVQAAVRAVRDDLLDAS